MTFYLLRSSGNCHWFLMAPASPCCRQMQLIISLLKKKFSLRSESFCIIAYCSHFCCYCYRLSCITVLMHARMYNSANVRTNADIGWYRHRYQLLKLLDRTSAHVGCAVPAIVWLGPATQRSGSGRPGLDPRFNLDLYLRRVITRCATHATSLAFAWREAKLLKSPLATFVFSEASLTSLNTSWP